MFPSNSVANNNILPGTWSFKCKRKPDWKTSKFKTSYCVTEDFHKRLSPKPLNSYYSAVQFSTVRLMLILICILSLQSYSMEFTNPFAQASIPSGNPVFIELHEISRLMRDNVILFSDQIKYFTINLNPHAYGTKFF